jgi:hypothetical protein
MPEKDRILKNSKETKQPPEMTTIAISVANQKELNKLRKGRESYDDVLSRLVNNQFDIYVEFLSIDNELPQLHNAAFQCGEDADSVFFFDGIHASRPSSLEEINKLVKQPKPNMVITREEAGRIVFELTGAKNSESQKIRERLIAFLKEKPLEKPE